MAIDKKIDILNDDQQIIVEYYEGEKSFYDIKKLSGDLLDSYNSFIQLTFDKTGRLYAHLFISIIPIKRFASIYNSGETFEEITYDVLSSTERDIFDTFYNIFI